MAQLVGKRRQDNAWAYWTASPAELVNLISVRNPIQNIRWIIFEHDI